jgi:hypothetical protein
MLLLYASLNRLRFHLLHNSRLLIIDGHYLIENRDLDYPKKRKKKSKCNEV